MKNWFAFVRTRMNAKIIVLLVASLSIASIYNACGKVKFGQNQDFAKSEISSGSSIVINSDAPYTRDVNVQLNLVNLKATEMFVTNDSKCQSGGAWEPYSTEKAWVLGSKNQNTAVFAKFRGENQVESECVSDNIVHDDIAPLVQLDIAVPSILAVSQVASLFHATDSGSGIDQLLCKSSDSLRSMPCTGSFSSANLRDGAYAIEFSATDKAGNISAPLVQSFKVDTTPPVVTLNSTPPVISGSSTGKFDFSGVDNLTGVQRFECKLDQQSTYSLCYTGQTYSGLSQGAHTFAIHAVDGAGNTSQDVVYAWAIDLTAPTVTITKMPPPLTNSKNAPFVFIGQDSGGNPLTQFECRVNGGAFASCSSSEAQPFMAQNVAEGLNTFGVRGKNQVGLYSSEATYKWNVDSIGPVITLTQKPPSLTNSNSATFAFSVVDDNGIGAVECSLDGGTYQDCKSLTQTYTGLTNDMKHTFQVRAKDGAGNQSVSSPYQWEIDLTPPDLKILSGPALLTSQTVATFQIKGTDTHLPLTYQCKLDNAAAFTACSETVNYTGLIEGVHVFYAKAIDAVGNESPIKNYAWSVDTTAPVIVFTKTPDPIISTVDQGVLSYSVTDSASGVGVLVCNIDSTVIACPDASGTLTFPQLPVGTHTFMLVASDKAGNQSSKSYAFEVQQAITFNSQNNVASIVFEDNFPVPGDADYNDGVFDFKTVELVNSNKQLTRITIDFYPVGRGAGYNHALMMVLDGTKDSSSFGDPSNLKNKTTALFNGDATITLKRIDPATGAIKSTVNNLSRENDLIIFQDTKSLFVDSKGVTQGFANVRNSDAKATAVENVRVEITILHPELNNVGDRTAPDLSKYRIILHVYDTHQDIDLVNVNRENVDANGYPYGMIIPLGWKYPQEGVKLDAAYPKFSTYRNYLKQLAIDPTYQAPAGALDWYTAPDPQHASDLYNR